MSSNKNPVIRDSDYNGVRVIHEGFAPDDLKQKMVNYAYKLGGYDFMAMIECENGNRDIHAVGDNGNAFGLCQMNQIYHKDIPAEYFTTRQTQIEYCYQKRTKGTVFYGPSRLVKGIKCYEYVKNRFTFIE